MKIEKEEIKQKILPILQRYGVTRAGIFGSYARREIHEDSDLDLIVEIGKDISLLDFIGLKIELEDTMGINIDLVEYNTLKPLLRDRILSEQIVLL